MDVAETSTVTVIDMGGSAETGNRSELMMSNGCQSLTFTTVQALFRLYLMPIVSLFGVFANLINIRVFASAKMRCQPVNWFFLSLALSDLVVLITSFLVFQLPMYAEEVNNIELYNTAQTVLVTFYPLAMSSHTCSVVLTVVVSVHRYLGVCHPFMIRRISTARVIRCTIAAAAAFAFLFNVPKWIELQVDSCYSDIYETSVLSIGPSRFMLDPVYNAIYSIFAYTTVMFILPFSVLTFVNIKIVMTLRSSHRLRRQMTARGKDDKKKKRKRSEDTTGLVKKIFKRHLSVSCEKGQTEELLGQLSPPNQINAPMSAKRESSQGVSVMLLAITCQFLAFNLLAFVQNIIELSGSGSSGSEDIPNEPSFAETLLTEARQIALNPFNMSTFLVNLNCASTIVIYLKFSTKFRVVFLGMLTSLGLRKHRPVSPSMHSTMPLETTVLLNSHSIRRRQFAAVGRSVSVQKSTHPPSGEGVPRTNRAMSAVPAVLDNTINGIHFTPPIRV